MTWFQSHQQPCAEGAQYLEYLWQQVGKSTTVSRCAHVSSICTSHRRAGAPRASLVQLLAILSYLGDQVPATSCGLLLSHCLIYYLHA